MTAMTIDVTSLYLSSIDVKPVTVDSWSDVFAWSEPDNEPAGAWWEVIDYERDEETLSLLSESGRIAGVIIDGTLYRDYDDYAADWEEDHPTDCTCSNLGHLAPHDDGCPVPNAEALAPMDESDWDELMEVEPAHWGGEGPMMNYWYPVESIDSDDRAESAAVAIAGLPLCVVMVSGAYGFALTGGGMDLSWDICRAYILTGNLPPVHFADLPRFAGGHGMTADVVQAMARSLDIMARQTESRLSRLRESFAEMMGADDE